MVPEPDPVHGSASTTRISRERSPSLRNAVFHALETAKEEDWFSKAVDVFLIALILASVIAVILESMPVNEAK